MQDEDDDRSTSYAFRFTFERDLEDETDRDDIGCLDCYSGEIVLKDDDSGDVIEKAGTISAWVIRGGAAMEARQSIFDACDAEDADLAVVAGAVYNKANMLKDSICAQFDDPCGSTVVYLDRIEVDPKHRGQNLGLRAARKFLDTVGHGAVLVTLIPQPLQYVQDHRPIDGEEERSIPPKGSPRYAQYKADLDKLRAYWSKLGVRRIKGTDVYAANLELRLPGMKALMPRKLKAVR